MEGDDILFDLENNKDGTRVDLEDTNDNAEEPTTNMSFTTIKELENYYKAYAMKQGFGVAHITSKKVDGLLTYVTIGCNRYGKSRRTSEKLFSQHPIIKTSCKARICVKLLDDGTWKVNTVVNEHNHELCPGNARYYRCNRKVPTSAKMKLMINDHAGIRVNKNIDALVVEASGHENLSFIEKDCRNYIDQMRRLKLGEGDAVAVLNYFKKMQSLDSDFFYAIDPDEDNRIQNLFWADARSRAACEEFGDVITFDTTYLTNRYDMPFAPFVGVNHHGHSTLLGCGLILKENTDTFTWLFESWLTCMSGRAPNAIITDQDGAMKNAIEIVFPKTRHRWCLWHIMKKIPEKFKGYANYESIKSCLHRIVYDSLEKDEFETEWQVMIEKYELDGDQWLAGLYKERHRWIPCFVRDYFWAGMSTTQRSESINAFFDGYVNSKTTLKQFVEAYDSALRSKVVKEKEADFNSYNGRVPCVTFYPMEKTFQEVYTLNKFKEFQQELKGLMICSPFFIKSLGPASFYEVAEHKNFGENHEFVKTINFRVDFVEDDVNKDFEVTCNCKLFEFRGIVCRHMISVLIRRGLFAIPNKYVLRRWRKDIKRRYTKSRVGYNDWQTSEEGRRYASMNKAFNEVVDVACESTEKCDQVMEVLHELKRSWTAHDSSSASDLQASQSNASNFVEAGTNKIIHSPIAKRCKGRPPTKRKQSKVDRIVENLRKKSTNAKKKKAKEISKSLNRASGHFHSQKNMSDTLSDVLTPLNDISGPSDMQRNINHNNFGYGGTTSFSDLLSFGHEELLSLDITENAYAKNNQALIKF